MEKVYPPSHFDCTEKITDLQEYFDSYSKLCKFVQEHELDLSPQELLLEKFSALIDQSRIKLRQSVDLCNVSDLTVPGELSPLEVFNSNKYTMRLKKKDESVPEAGNQLETVQAKIKYENFSFKQKELDNVFLEPKKSAIHNIPLEELLISVRVYQPFSAMLKRKLARKLDKLKCSHEITALASNKLSELRDKILCVNDNGLSLEINDLKDNVMKDVKEEYPSGLIGINDALYSDMRHANAIDYSEVIRDWGKKKHIADFKMFPMDEVCLKDLNFRLGYPYIYQHRGNCEHILVFTDIKLIKRSDPLSLSDYPYYRSINRYNSERCNICHATIAKWICCDSDRLPYDRAFLCEECFVSYNYIGEQKVGDFKAYRYYHKSTVI